MNKIKNWQSLKEYDDENYFDDDNEYQPSEPINPILCQTKSDLKAKHIFKKKVYHEPVSCQVMCLAHKVVEKALKICIYEYTF